MKSIPLFFTSLCLALYWYAAGEKIDLPGTTIEMPWERFAGLINRKPDTVRISNAGRFGTPIVFDEARMTATLFDSSARIDVALQYSVLDTSGWPTALVFDKSIEPALFDVRMPAGDYCKSADSGLIVIARAGKGIAASRTMGMQWVQVSEGTTGSRSCSIALPHASRRILTVEAPLTYTGITIEHGVQITKQRNAQSIRYLFSIPSGITAATLQYLPPLPALPHPEALSETVEKDTLITAIQETGLFATDEDLLCITALTLTVAHSPITRFTVSLPADFSILKVEGNGIGKWTPGKGNTLDISLQFALKGNYLIHITGELPYDSIVDIPSFTISNALRQKGRFALFASGNKEAELLSINNAMNIAPSDFLKESSPEFTRASSAITTTAREMICAGSYYKLPFGVRVKIRQHATVPIANALADIGTLNTVIAENHAVLTIAAFTVRERNRQFISFKLPEKAELWAVSVNDAPATPLRGDSGYYKIPLQRFMKSASGENAFSLSVMYLESRPSAGKPMNVTLVAPGIDVPVGRLTWTVFYPERWRIKKVSGDFIASRACFMATTLTTLDKAESGERIRVIQKQAAQQARSSGGSGNVIGALSEKSKNIQAYTLLVVEERPIMKIRFGKAGTSVWIVLCAALCIAAGTFILHRVLKKR
jgi:hypothetical protein